MNIRLITQTSKIVKPNCFSLTLFTRTLLRNRPDILDQIKIEGISNFSRNLDKFLIFNY